ncbi:hypothetical protein M5D96_004050, partial [Drosophila gunungcola]
PRHLASSPPSPDQHQFISFIFFAASGIYNQAFFVPFRLPGIFVVSLPLRHLSSARATGSGLIAGTPREMNT